MRVLENFWNCSWIYVTRCGDGGENLDSCRFTQVEQGSKAYEGHKILDGRLNAFQLSQRYSLERYCEAARAVSEPSAASILCVLGVQNGRNARQ